MIPDICCIFQFYIYYQIPKFLKFKCIIIIVLPNSWHYYCARVISPFLRGSTEHIRASLLLSFCLGITVFHHIHFGIILGSHQDIFFSRANKQTNKQSCLLTLLCAEHQIMKQHQQGYTLSTQK